MRQIVILGRLPAIGTAELEAVFGTKNIQPIKPGFVYVDDLNLLDQAPTLGGVIKVAEVITEINSPDWQKVINFISKSLPSLISNLPEGKLNLGISAYGFDILPARINASALSFKKVIKNSGKSVRIVPNKQPDLNAAQILYNKLISENGIELVIIKDNSKTIVGKTVYVQDIDAYAARDQMRPARDARVGMLPPKLAQTIINLSGFDGQQTLLDPFCGTGVILQEALLMGTKVIGTDLEPRMIEYSQKNLTWLKNGQFKDDFILKVADATSANWSSYNFSTIACETYLGRPLSSTPDPQTLQKIVQDCDTIHKKFLQNVTRQTKTGFRMCIAVPAWKLKNGFRHLRTLDHLEELGYNRMSFEFADNKDLIYHREGQQVARELVVLERI